MALMLSKTYEAFLAGGAPADKAQAAAEELAAYDSRLSNMDSRLAVLTWIGTTNLALTVTGLFKLFH